MNKFIRKNKGITLISLAVTIIVIFILAGVTIGTLSGVGKNVSESKETIDISQLNKIQQAVFENYVKYKQTHNDKYLVGTKMTYADAKAAFDTLGSSTVLKRSEDDATDLSTYYYKLEKWQLAEMGLENTNNDEYIVNYSTGEVFNITEKKTESGETLYTATGEKADEYIKSGLVLHLDGIKNTRNGHNATSTVWEDLSGNGNDGTLANFNNTSTSGWGTNCINFDSVDDIISIQESSTTNPVDQTIEVVLKCNGESLNSSDGRQIFFVKWVGYTMEINRNNTIDRKIRYGRKNGYLSTNSSIEYGKKYYITATHQNSISKIYLNNIYENQQDITPDNYSGMKEITIGNYSADSKYFNGSIYAIRMYNRALTDAEIAHNYAIDKERFGIED